jgi:hypothetical protein
MDSLLQLASQYPLPASVLMLMGALRMINKPLFLILRTIADATPTLKDNEWLEKVERSKLYVSLSFILDYVASVKLPQKVRVVSDGDASKLP